MLNTELQILARKRVNELSNKAYEIFGCYVHPIIDYNLKGRVAGKAFYYKEMIKLNLDLFRENQKGFLEDTIPHEMAHLISHEIKLECKPHGKTWKRVMIMFGCEPKRCHNYKTTSARNVKRYRYSCGCSIHEISLTRHKRTMKGVKYICKKCKKALKKV